MPKTLEIIAGPNGSGKTTFAELALGKRKECLYINSDTIARGLTPNGSKLAQYEAGRIMLRAIEAALNHNHSFGFETTFSGKMWTSFIQRAKQSGYKIIIYFVFVQTVGLSLKRILARVRSGGHSVEEKIVRRRFRRTFQNFVNLYMPLANEWYIIDNTRKPILAAQMKKGTKEIFDKKLFQRYFT